MWASMARARAVRAGFRFLPPRRGAFWVVSALLMAREITSPIRHPQAGSLRIEVPPQEPDCLDDHDHEWTDEVVRGNGGGIRSTDRCAHCGVRRTYDTWAQDPVDGSQGHKAWSFQPAEDE